MLTGLRTCVFSLLLCFSAARKHFGDLYIDTQAGADAASGITSITGFLFLDHSATDPITDLSPLNDLETLGGYLQITHQGALLSALGVFPSLVRADSGIYITNNPVLASLTGFASLETTGDNIDIWYNPVLAYLDVFPMLRVVGWSLEFGGNPMLLDLPHLESLETIRSSLFILDNVNLQRIEGFDRLEYIDWSFSVIGQSRLESMCALTGFLERTGGYTGGGTFIVRYNGPTFPEDMSVAEVGALEVCAYWGDENTPCRRPDDCDGGDCRQGKCKRAHKAKI
jgi:hypothetical protein